MKSLKTILADIDLTRDTHVSREFQRFGLYVAEQLDDPAHKSLYIKMAKEYPRQLLEEALSFSRDAKARNKAAIFMWKLKELKNPKSKNQPPASPAGGQISTPNSKLVD